VSQPGVSSPSGGRDPAAIRAQFDAEVRAADLALADDDRERLFAMWADHLPTRDQLQAADVAPAEEPSFAEKATLAGGGVTPVTAGTPGPSAGPSGGAA
jgi:hypothetical protein